MSFSQLVYPHRYGEESAYDSLKATDYNLYSPKDQILMVAAFLGTEKTTGNDCQGGMNIAFVSDGLGRSYDDVPDLVGIVNGNLGTEEDEYEKLAKAISFYNSNTWVSGVNRHSWPYLMRNMVYDSGSAVNSVSKRICHSCKYSVEIRKYFFGSDHLRSYIWAGADADNDGQPDWCFVYGKREWLSGTSYAQARQDASDTNSDGTSQTPVGRVICN